MNTEMKYLKYEFCIFILYKEDVHPSVKPEMASGIEAFSLVSVD
jgi:hypothetical protein